MATKAQLEAARTNIKKAQAASRTKRALVHQSVSTRRALGEQGADGRLRGSEAGGPSTRSALDQQGAEGRLRVGEAGRPLEDRNRQQLYALARQHRVSGRATMGKHELIAAIRKVR